MSDPWLIAMDVSVRILAAVFGVCCLLVLHFTIYEDSRHWRDRSVSVVVGLIMFCMSVSAVFKGMPK